MSTYGNFAHRTATINIGRTMPNTSYLVLATVQRSGCPASCCVAAKTTTSFTVDVFTTAGPTYEGFVIDWLVIG